MPYEPSDSMYKGAFLPHTDAGGRPQMITTRLSDSLPRDIFRSIKDKASCQAERRALTEQYLDDGRGHCWLGREDLAKIAANSLKFYDGKNYKLIDWVIMPNHIHLVYDKPRKSIGRIVGSYKSYTAQECNRLLERAGRSFWQRDYYDRYARDSLHLFTMSCYVILNPVKAGLVDDPFDWPYSSVHDYHPDFKEDLRRWYRSYKSSFWRSIES